MNTLHHHLTHLTALVSDAIIRGTEALITHDQALARQVSADDANLNRVRFAIEEHTYSLLEAGQLCDRDVRIVVSMVIVSQALEHIGDSAANLAYLAMRTSSIKTGTTKAIDEELTEMARSAAEMVLAAVTAFVEGDARMAEAAVRRDRELNDAYEALSNSTGPADTAERRLMLLWAAHNLQQIGAQASTICERAIFVATGELKEFR
jgi:phosphate transport system protein